MAACNTSNSIEQPTFRTTVCQHLILFKKNLRFRFTGRRGSHACQSPLPSHCLISTPSPFPSSLISPGCWPAKDPLNSPSNLPNLPWHNVHLLLRNILLLPSPLARQPPRGQTQSLPTPSQPIIDLPNIFFSKPLPSSSPLTTKQLPSATPTARLQHIPLELPILDPTFPRLLPRAAPTDLPPSPTNDAPAGPNADTWPTTLTRPARSASTRVKLERQKDRSAAAGTDYV